jgi:uncharacterized protein (TIGR03435 family)
MNVSTIVVSAFIVTGAAASQPNPTTFEVASVKATGEANRIVPGIPAGGFARFADGGRFSAINVNLAVVLRFAYRVKDLQISGGPGWVYSASPADHFDFEAKAEENTDPEHMRPMIRALLEDRFHLKTHREMKEMPIYALVLGKQGSRLHASSSEERADGRPIFEDGRNCGKYVATKLPVSALVEVLATPTRSIVVDKTGLQGEYDFTVEWNPSPLEDTGCPSIFTSVQQLGLRLEAQKGPVETIVIDHVEKPSPN